MTSGLTRMSTLTSWVPLKVFSEGEEFTVRKLRGRNSVAHAALEAASATSD